MVIEIRWNSNQRLLGMSGKALAQRVLACVQDYLRETKPTYFGAESSHQAAVRVFVCRLWEE